MQTYGEIIGKKEALREKLNNHHKRYFRYLGNVDEEKIIDLKNLPHKIESVMKKNKATQTEIKRALSDREKYITPIINDIRLLSYKINSLLRRNGVDLKGDEYVLNQHKEHVLNMFGRFMSVRDVDKYLKAQGTPVQMDAIVHFRQIHEEKIKKLRTQFELENGNGENRVATDIGRLSVLNELLSFWENERENGANAKTSTDMIVKILEAARKEVKGEVLTVNGSLQIDINATIQAQKSIGDVFREVNIHSMLLAMVSVKRGLDPTHILAQLQASWYSKLNGFSPIQDMEIEHPSSIIKTFDWGTVEALQDVNRPTPKLIPQSNKTTSKNLSEALAKAKSYINKPIDGR